VQTHISLVFLGPDRVYKVKKAVRFAFLDYSTLERRRHFCEEEVRLNAPLAPGVYRGVVPVTRDDDGALTFGGDGEIVEYAVSMERLPDARMLERLLERGEIDNDLIRRVVALLAEFHANAVCTPKYGEPEHVRRRVLEVLEDTRATLPRFLHDRFAERLSAFVDTRRPLLERRVANGRIREGHGDLHAGNVCLLPDRIVVYDRIEFSESFRCGDVATDLAFFAMDLDMRGFHAFGSYLVHAYAEASGDAELPALMDFYKTHRATIRGRVAGYRFRDENVPDDERAAAKLESLRYYHLAAAYLTEPSLIVMCGLPASGKSGLARRIAVPFGAAVLRSDVVRKQIAGVAATKRWHGDYSGGPYDPSITDATYKRLLEEARTYLASGRSVVVDATCRDRAIRDRFAKLGHPLVVVHTQCSEDETRRRMEARRHDTREVSDADFAIYLRASKEFEPPAPPEPIVVHEGALPPEDTITSILRLLPDRPIGSG